MVMRTAVKVVVVSRCVRGIDGCGLHKTNLAALRDALAGVARPGLPVPGGRLRGARVRLRAAPDRRRRRHERRDRRRLDRGQGHARPLHAPRRRAAPGLGVPLARRLLDARAPRRRSSARASRRCTGCRSRARRTSSSRSRRRATSERRLEVVEAHELPRASMTTPIASKRRSAECGRSRDLEQEGRGHPAHLPALALVQRLPRSAPGAAGAPRLDLDEDERRPVEDDEVELAVARAVVARDERVAEALEVGEGEVLAERGRGADAGPWARRRR